MTIVTKKRNLSEKISFVKNDSARIEIPQDNLIRRISLLFTIGLTSGASAGSTPKEDGYLNAVKKIRLEMGGDENKVNVDAVKLFYFETFMKGAKPSLDAVVIPAATNSNIKKFQLNLDFAQSPQNLNDISALIDSEALSSLDLVIDWGSISDILSTVSNTTIDASTTKCDVTLTEVFEDEGKVIDGTFKDIRIGVDKFTVTKANTSFDDSIQEEDITPTRSNIRSTMLLTRLDTGVKDNGIIDQLKVENVKGSGSKLYQSIFDEAQRENKPEYSLENQDTGLLFIDWLDRLRNGLGNFDANALKWRFLTAAPAAGKENTIEVLKVYTV